MRTSNSCNINIRNVVVYSIPFPCPWLFKVYPIFTIFSSMLITSLFIRYLSDHGYNLATDSGSVIDTQKIVKRLLDVCIDSLNLYGVDYLGYMNELEKKWIIYSLTWERLEVEMEILIKAILCCKYKRYVM